MKPKTPEIPNNRDMFRPLLVDIINPQHELVLTMFLQSPYYQHFCGRIYFEHQLPIDPSSLVRWRKRVGEAGMEEMLLKSIEAAVSVDLVKPQSFTEVIVDTTVMAKAITNPTDSKLLEKSRQRLVKLAQRAILTNTPTERVFVDKGYCGHSVTDCDVYISGQKRNMTSRLKRKLKRRSVIEATIGHMKTEGRLDRCTLKGQIGDAMFALLCAAGHNLRLILNFLRNFWHHLLAMLCFTSTPNFKA